MLRLTKACQIPKFKVSPGGVYVTLWQLSWGIKRIKPWALGKVHLSWRAVCHAGGVKRSPLHGITWTKSDALSPKVKPPSSNTSIHSAKRKIVLMLCTGLEALANYFLSSQIVLPSFLPYLIFNFDSIRLCWHQIPSCDKKNRIFLPFIFSVRPLCFYFNNFLHNQHLKQTQPSVALNFWQPQ